MDEIVESVKKVAEIMKDITFASQEQSIGIDSVTNAIIQMDDMTQQNSTLVEEATAATESMRIQAGSLARAVSVFKLSDVQEMSDPSNVDSDEMFQEEVSVARLPGKRTAKKLLA